MTKDGIKTHHSWDKVRWVVASILLLAAIMKAWQLATVPILGEGLFHARWFNLGLVEFELAFGLWLAFGFFPKLSRWATIALFTAFAGVSLYKALTGEPSCGCFGSAQVNPWWTFVLDATIVGASLSCREPSTASVSNQRIKAIGIILLWTIGSVIFLQTVKSVKKYDLPALGTEFVGADGQKTVLIEPEKWKEGEFPLLPYIEPAEARKQLKTGDWTIAFYHHECPNCQKAIAEIVSKETLNVVCIEVPPYGSKNNLPVDFVSAKLTDKVAWSVQTPLIIRMNQESK